MGIYSRYIFPRLMNWGLSHSEVTRLRKALLRDVEGKILEIGFGTGLNLPHYSPGVQLFALEPNPGMLPLIDRARKSSEKTFTLCLGDAQRIPFRSESFDAAVSCWTLCSIADVGRALDEIRRILRPRGRFFILEHGLSREPSIQRWQHRLTPVQKRLGDGCHLNRDMKNLVESRGFQFIELEEAYQEKAPRIFGYFYRGIAVRR
ncbi:MAG TPA: class I SAM-dependent methyltransferase [Acidobacteriota bacterium]|nr:class I SAM-dependent methyltransferase [Acidobacteriota bacterium]